MQILEAHVSLEFSNLQQSVERWLRRSAEELRLEAHR